MSEEEIKEHLKVCEKFVPNLFTAGEIFGLKWVLGLNEHGATQDSRE